jgi:hypothetical protein
MYVEPGVLAIAVADDTAVDATVAVTALVYVKVVVVAAVTVHGPVDELKFESTPSTHTALPAVKPCADAVVSVAIPDVIALLVIVPPTVRAVVANTNWSVPLANAQAVVTRPVTPP